MPQRSPRASFLAPPLARVSALLLLCAVLIAHTGAFAANQGQGSKSSKKPPSKVTFIDSPSSESPQARSKRLKVECKGRPNAGMCLGHTR